MSDKKELDQEEIQTRLFVVENVVRNLIQIVVYHLSEETGKEETLANLAGLDEAWAEVITEIAEKRSRIIKP